MFIDMSSRPRLTLLRHSGKPRDMIAPRPGQANLRWTLSSAVRTRDQVAPAPWRHDVVEAAQVSSFAALIDRAICGTRPASGRSETAATKELAH
jgi:hypothetical protein